MPVQADSFQFGGVDMLAAYGIRCVASDALLPGLRPRKLTVPGRDGQYDFGARYYDERTVRLECDSMRQLSRQELRDVAGLLTRKNRLVLWDEPDKYYIGRVYSEAELSYIGRVGHAFTLTFVCDPFAYGLTVDAAMPVRFAYAGTAQTPTRIEIKNNGTAAIRGIRMIIRKRSDVV